MILLPCTFCRWTPRAATFLKPRWQWEQTDKSSPSGTAQIFSSSPVLCQPHCRSWSSCCAFASISSRHMLLRCKCWASAFRKSLRRWHHCGANSHQLSCESRSSSAAGHSLSSTLDLAHLTDSSKPASHEPVPATVQSNMMFWKMVVSRQRHNWTRTRNRQLDYRICFKMGWVGSTTD